MGTGDSWIIACRTSSKFTPPVERSITVSAPYLTASLSFSTSSLISLALGEAPILALTLHLEAIPIDIGSRFKWLILAGIINLPLATSSIIKEEGRFSFLATKSISSVICPFLAKFIWVTLSFPRRGLIQVLLIISWCLKMLLLKFDQISTSLHRN